MSKYWFNKDCRKAEREPRVVYKDKFTYFFSYWRVILQTNHYKNLRDRQCIKLEQQPMLKILLYSGVQLAGGLKSFSLNSVLYQESSEMLIFKLYKKGRIHKILRWTPEQQSPSVFICVYWCSAFLPDEVTLGFRIWNLVALCPFLPLSYKICLATCIFHFWTEDSFSTQNDLYRPSAVPLPLPKKDKAKSN